MLVGGLAGAGARDLWPSISVRGVMDGAAPSAKSAPGGPSTSATSRTQAQTRARREADLARAAGRTTTAETLLLRTGRATARQVLSALRDRPVREARAVPGYARSRFGSTDRDLNGNGCSTRNDILRRDLQGVRLLKASDPCVVSEGILADPYTGRSLEFHRETSSSRRVVVANLVPLQNAWSSGASTWPPGRRAALAGDPLNLLAVDSLAEARRQGRDAAGWLPNNFSFQCTYVSRQLAVKIKYDLSITDAERRAVEGVLTVCSDKVIWLGATGTVPVPPRSLPVSADVGADGPDPAYEPGSGAGPGAGSGGPVGTGGAGGATGLTGQVGSTVSRCVATDFHCGVPAV